MSDSLWGEIPVAAVLNTPNSILSKQGDILSQATSGDLVGTTEKKVYSNGSFGIEFYITAPSLNNYRYQLLRAVHDVHLYPLRILQNDTLLECSDENAFRKVVGEILSSSSTHHIIQALLAQVRDDGEDIPF